MDQETKRAKAQMKELSVKDRIKNYWYYYKVHFFVAVICFCFLAVTVVQCANRIDYDMTVSMYTTKKISDETLTELSQLLKSECVDINGDEAVNVDLKSNVADISKGVSNEMTFAMQQKLIAEFAASTAEAFVMDEVFKNYMVNGYEYPIEDVVEISCNPQIRQQLKLAEDEKLYWMPAFKRKDTDKPDPFVNVERLKQFFNSKRES